MSSSFDVIIIGAGAAGLAAGRVLAAANQRVCLIEARSRIGGRICTEHAGVPLEMGAEFIHGHPAVTWSLIKEAGFETYELAGQPYSYEQSRLQPTSPLADDAFKVIEDMARWWMTESSSRDLSFARYLAQAKLPMQVSERALGYVEGFNAADAARISVAALVRQQMAEDDIQADQIFHVGDGYDSLPAFLARSFELLGGEMRLSHEVTEIRWNRSGVQVSGGTPAFSLTARQAVVTLPLGVLQSDLVCFSPSIPTLDTSLTTLAMGSVLRVSFLFDRAFWTDRAPKMGFMFSPGQVIPTWWSSQPNSTPLLTAWVGGQSAYQRAATLRGDALIEAGLQQLGQMFGIQPSRLRSMLQRAVTHDWAADRHSLGAYSYATVGGVNSSSRMAEPVDDVLFFAGEHTDPAGHWGTVHAALASGVRAAEQILLRAG